MLSDVRDFACVGRHHRRYAAWSVCVSCRLRTLNIDQQCHLLYSADIVRTGHCWQLSDMRRQCHLILGQSLVTLFRRFPGDVVTVVSLIQSPKLLFHRPKERWLGLLLTLEFLYLRSHCCFLWAIRHRRCHHPKLSQWDSFREQSQRY